MQTGDLELMYDAVVEQANQLNDILDIPQRQAEAYLLWMQASDEVKDKEIAEIMECSPGTFSQHIGAAKSFFEREESLERLLTVWATNPPYESGGHNYRPVAFEGRRDDAILVVEHYKGEERPSFAPLYRIFLLTHKKQEDEYIEELPEDIILPTTMTVTTLEADSKEGIKKAIDFHLTQSEEWEEKDYTIGLNIISQMNIIANISELDIAQEMDILSELTS